jgi:hypothetical protein
MMITTEFRPDSVRNSVVITKTGAYRSGRASHGASAARSPVNPS